MRAVFFFIPAANHREFTLFLLGSFIIGTGLATLETAANPYAARLGPEETATTRLNLAQSFNGLAATVGPFLGTFFILSGKEFSAEELALMPEAEKISYFTAEAASVKGPYLYIGIILLVLALLFYFMKFPEIEENGKKDEPGSFLAAWKYPGLRLAVVAQFFLRGGAGVHHQLFYPDGHDRRRNGGKRSGLVPGIVRVPVHGRKVCRHRPYPDHCPGPLAGRLCGGRHSFVYHGHSSPGKPGGIC
ncbi:MAG: MFS transporter, partial [Leadbetterella sp.]|nr:MFS transporter [Leadbetterella sp.]